MQRGTGEKEGTRKRENMREKGGRGKLLTG